MLPEKVSSYDHENEDTVTKTKIYDMRTSYTYDRFTYFLLSIFIYLVTFIGYNLTYLWTIYNISQLRNEIDVLFIIQMKKPKITIF